MNEQVLSIEEMQEVEDLGIDTSKASMCWGKWNSAKEYHLFAENKADRESFIQDLIKYNCIDEEDEEEYAHETISTFTLQDILEILPSYSITYDKYTNDLDRYEIRVNIPKKQNYITHIAQSSKSLLEAAFKMLKWCKENGDI